MTEKLIGYVLLTVGLIVILFSGFSVYQVFTKKAEPVRLFTFNGVSLDMAALVGGGDGLSVEQQALLEKQKAQIKPQEIISGAMLNDTSNLAAHLFLMGFVASIGYRIASLGVQLVRTIVVDLKEAKPPKTDPSKAV